MDAFRIPYYESYDPANIVYLSADATETLTDLEDGKVYMIGGIVDKNRYPVYLLNHNDLVASSKERKLMRVT